MGGPYGTLSAAGNFVISGIRPEVQLGTISYGTPVVVLQSGVGWSMR